MKRTINYANLELTIVYQTKGTKNKPSDYKTEKIILKEQIVIGDTPLEVMSFSYRFATEIKEMYKDVLFFIVNKMEIIKSLSKTQYGIKSRKPIRRL
jgi:hypothetical protein